jgi:hypothetical protein
VNRALAACVVIIASACASVPATTGRAIVGNVVGADGAPIDGARVFLQRPGPRAPVLSAADPMVRTNAQGLFRFDAPAAGRHQLLLLHPTLGWLIVQGAAPGPALRIVFDGKTRVIEIGRRE